MNLIAKKIKGFYGNKNGIIRPLFHFDTLDKLVPINPDEYPNNGCIIVSDYELLDSDIQGDIFVMENCFFIGDDNLYHEKVHENNACQKRINYNAKISSFFKPISPIRLIPIYDNRFQLSNNRLNNTENITSQVFFLKDPTSSEIYGPFERDSHDLKAANFQNFDDDFYTADTERDFLEQYSEFDGSVIYKFKEDDIKDFLVSDSQGCQYLNNFADFFEDNIGVQLEFTPISVLHKWALDNFGKKSNRLHETLSEIKNLDIQPSSTLDRLRWDRYVELLNQMKNDNKIIEDVVDILYQNGFISNIGESSELEKSKKEIIEAKEDIKIKNDEIIKLKDEREALAEKVKEINTSKSSGIVDRELYPNLANLLLNPDTLRELEEEVQDRDAKNALTADIQRLKFEQEFISNDIKKHEETKRKVEESVRLIKQSFDNDVAVHTAKLGEAKIYTDLLNGINITSTDFENKKAPEEINISPIPSEINSAKAYVNEIQKRLKAQGREISFNEVANLVITTNQSFLTIIAGAPGVGKTSIVEKLARSYGLNPNLGYLEVNCARGWTSSKDLIGFYNPLTGKYQQSKTRLKEMLEMSNGNIDAPFIVLLDEANLSPMEHYWSDFIKLADRDYARIIKVSDKEEIHFGDGFRFIATINHDHTTEALSNRLLDRAAIIQIDRASNISEDQINEFKEENVFGYAEVQKLFNETSKWKSDEELIKKFLNQLKEKIESNNSGIVISPRKELAIRKYCRVATGLLDGNSYAALDYAVAQHIFPLINGRGEAFEANLRAIRNDLVDKGMGKSDKLLGKILDRGKDMKHYKYIYY